MITKSAGYQKDALRRAGVGIKLPKSTPKGIVNYIEYLEKDRDNERDGLYNLRRWLETNHPEIIKEYDNDRLIRAITGCNDRLVEAISGKTKS